MRMRVWRRRGRMGTAARVRMSLGLLMAFSVATACGARVSAEQVEAMRAESASFQQSGGTPGHTAEAAGTGAASAAGVDSGIVATTDGGAEGASPGASGAATTPSTPAGDNGGATDVGVTADQVTIGAVATMSGPVPGLFAGAVRGIQAWVGYQNSIGGIHGRKLKVEVRDDQFDTGQNRAQSIELSNKTFALVGGFSLYDDAAVKDFEARGVPIVQLPVSKALQDSPMNFSVQPLARGALSGAWNALKAEFPQAITAAAALYSDVPAAVDQWRNQQYAAESVGYKFVYDRAQQATETDFTADVVRMKAAGVRLVFSMQNPQNNARIVKAMQQQGFKPDVFAGVSSYDATFIPLAGAAAEGVVNLNQQAMYLGEDAAAIPEIKLMQTWVDKVKPGSKPDLFTVYGWTSGRLFSQALETAGPKATRAKLLAELKKITRFTANGLLPEAGPGDKRPASCFLIVRVQSGRWERYLSPPAPAFNCSNSQFVRRP
jgi:ABC-type branched-subunit amino acid transport system substrate-binding protein